MMEKYMKMANFYRYPADGEIKEFQVTEKIDGANFRFMLIDSMNTKFGSRNVEGIDHDATGSSESNGGLKSFGTYINYVKNSMRGNGYPTDWHIRYTFFMEALMPHKIKYEVDKDYLALGFAVYDHEEQKYVAEWERMFETLGLPVVPVLAEIETNPYDWELFIQKDDVEGIISNYDGKSKLEGIVMADYENQVFYKIKTKAFTEVSREKKAKILTGSYSDFVNKYATEYRMDKLIDLMELEETYNPKKPFPSVVSSILHDIITEADPRDLKKAFGRDLMPLIAQAVRDHPKVLGRVIGLQKVGK